MCQRSNKIQAGRLNTKMLMQTDSIHPEFLLSRFITSCGIRFNFLRSAGLGFLFSAICSREKSSTSGWALGLGSRERMTLSPK